MADHPTKNDAASVKGMARIAQRLVQARKPTPVWRCFGVVLFDVPTAATRMRRDISAQITAALGGVAPLFEATIRHSVAAVAARGRGLLVHQYAGELAGEPAFILQLVNATHTNIAHSSTEPAQAGMCDGDLRQAHGGAGVAET